MMLGVALSVSASLRSATGPIDIVAPSIGDTVTLSSLGVAPDGKGTYLFKGTLTATGTGAVQSLLQLDIGVSSTRFLLSNAGGSTQTVLTRTLVSAASPVNVGTVTGGVEFSIGMAVDGLGGAIASLGGAASVSVTGGATSGFTTLRFGVGAAGALPMAGSIALVRVRPGLALAAADLEAAVSAL